MGRKFAELTGIAVGPCHRPDNADLFYSVLPNSNSFPMNGTLTGNGTA